jgi:toxin ParE1/3/4
MAERKPPVLWSLEALGDVDRLWDYYAKLSGQTIADRVIREVAKAVAAIGDFPLVGRSRDEIRPGIRSLAASPHVVFYRLKGGLPEVVRVLDGRQDIGEIFSEDEGGNGSSMF